MADELLTDEYRNATVYTAWSHGYLPDLINAVAGKALGDERVITEDWNNEDFDSLYVITLTWHDGKASMLSRNVRQGLDGGNKACRPEPGRDDQRPRRIGQPTTFSPAA